MLNPRRLLPIVVALAMIAFAVRALRHSLHQVTLADVVRDLHLIPVPNLLLAALLVLVLYTALAMYEAIVARSLSGPVSNRRAMLGALLAAPIGHVLGWGAVSGGAIRYRLYRAVLMRPLDIGKFVLLAAMPYPLGLGLLLGISLVMQSAAAALILHVPEPLARGTGLALLAIHVLYVLLVVNRRQPFAFRRLVVSLPAPPLTGVQYLIGVIEVCSGASIFYLLLPQGVAPPFVVFIGVYVLSILAGLVSGVPAGVGAFEAVMVTLLPHVARDQLVAAVIAYRVLLEVAPFAIAVTLLLAYEGWWRLPRQRARHDELKREHDRQRDL